MKLARSAWVIIPVAILLTVVIVMIGVLLVEPDNTAPDNLTTQNADLNDWLQFNANPQHSGTITTETILSPTNVSHLQLLYSVPLSGTVDGAPVYLANVKTKAGVRNLLFATTTAGDILALDSANGQPVWVQHNPAPNCFRNASQNPCYTTSSPAIDPNRQFVYSYGLDGYVHKYQVGDGTEVKGTGWPELTSAKLSEEKGSSALTIVTTKSGDHYLYMTHAYYPDGTRRDQGHLTAINLATGSQHTFNTVCSDQVDQHFGAPGVQDCSAVEDGIWARGSVIYSPVTDRIYFTAGCCSYDPAKHQWGQTVLALHPDGTGGPGGTPLDSYTQADWQNLNEATQIASSAPALFACPTQQQI